MTRARVPAQGVPDDLLQRQVDLVQGRQQRDALLVRPFAGLGASVHNPQRGRGGRARRKISGADALDLQSHRLREGRR